VEVNTPTQPAPKSRRREVAVFTKHRIEAAVQKYLGLRAYLLMFGLYTALRWRRAEPEFFRFLKLVPDGGTILDIGANLGVTALFFSRKCPHAQIVAFEPVASNCENIEMMAKLFRLRNVSVRNCALGDRNGKAGFSIPVLDGSRMQALGHLKNLSMQSGDDSSEQDEQIDVLVTRLDDLNLDDITAIKIDVEGSEREVLLGSIETLKRCKPLIYCELWNNESRSQSLELFSSLGYVGHAIRSQEMVPLDGTQHKEAAGENVIFLPR
jgi:FkbM family methyltransferase